MATTNEITRRNGAAPSTKVLSIHAARLARAITNVVARPSRSPVALLFVTPITGHSPRKYTSTKFVTIAAETKIQKRLVIRARPQAPAAAWQFQRRRLVRP